MCDYSDYNVTSELFLDIKKINFMEEPVSCRSFSFSNVWWHFVLSLKSPYGELSIKYCIVLYLFPCSRELLIKVAWKYLCEHDGD